MGVELESGILQAIRAFQDAGVGEGDWEVALRSLAEATGSVRGQLIGLGADGAVPFNLTSEIPYDAIESAAQIDLADPRVYSPGCDGSADPDLTIFHGLDVTSEEDHRRFADYGAFIDRFDFPFLCLMPLVRQGPMLIGLAVNRRLNEGQITENQRLAFTTIAPHARGAVRAQLALGSQGPAFVVGTLESVGLAGFVCDPAGRVRAMTPSAERLVTGGKALLLRGGILRASVEVENRALADALARVTGDELAPAVAEIAIGGGQGDVGLVLQFARLSQSLLAGSSAIVVVRAMSSAGTASTAAVKTAKALLRLTQAETAVLARLISGERPGLIATGLGVSITTVRTHVRNILSKAGTRSVVGLIARMRSL